MNILQQSRLWIGNDSTPRPILIWATSQPTQTDRPWCGACEVFVSCGGGEASLVPTVSGNCAESVRRFQKTREIPTTSGAVRIRNPYVTSSRHYHFWTRRRVSFVTLCSRSILPYPASLCIIWQRFWESSSATMCQIVSIWTKLGQMPNENGMMQQTRDESPRYSTNAWHRPL